MPKYVDHDGHTGLVRLWRVGLRYGYVILSLFALGIIAAAATGYALTPIFRATALVMVADELPKIMGMQGMVPGEIPVSRHYRTQCTLITSRSVLRAAARRLNLNSESAGADELQGSKISAAPVYNTQLIKVSAEGPAREKLGDIANAVVDAYREDTIQRRKSSSEYATGWISEQLPRLRAEVVAAEKRLHTFQKENRVTSLDRTHDIVSQRLMHLNQDFAVAERKRRELEAELAQIEVVDEEAVNFLPLVAENAAVREFDAQMLSLQGQKTDLLQTVRPDHRDVRLLDAKISDLEAKRRAAVRGILASFRRRLDSARINEQMLLQALAEQEKKALEVNEKMVQLNSLQGEVDRAKQLYEPMLERWGRLDLASGLKADPVRIIERAEEPTVPVKPRKKLMLLAGAFLGLLAGFQLAFILDRAYSQVRSAEELKLSTGLAAVGAVPHIDAREDRKRSLACHLDRRSAAAEAYRSIRTGLLHGVSGSGSPTFLVTSTVDQEGKTTTALNVAVALAQTQKRVLVIDGDMRRSSVHRSLGIDLGQGLSECLSDSKHVGELARETEVPSLWAMTAGASPENPSELLGSARMRSVIDEARGAFDYTVIDSPPLVAVTDARLLAPLVDGVVLVVRAERTPRRAVVRGRELLENARGTVIGAVMNDIPRKGISYYDYK